MASPTAQAVDAAPAPQVATSPSTAKFGFTLTASACGIHNKASMKRSSLSGDEWRPSRDRSVMWDGLAWTRPLPRNRGHQTGLAKEVARIDQRAVQRVARCLP